MSALSALQQCAGTLSTAVQRRSVCATPAQPAALAVQHQQQKQQQRQAAGSCLLQHQHQQRERQLAVKRQHSGDAGHDTQQSHPAARLLLSAVALVLQLQVLSVPVSSAAELLESSIQSEGNVPSELSAAGEAPQGPPLSSLMQGSNRKQIEGCTRRCVPTCIRGGEGAPGLGPISMRREIVVFKEKGFRSRQYCLSECAQVCKLMSDNEQQQQQQQQQKQP